MKLYTTGEFISNDISFEKKNFTTKMNFNSEILLQLVNMNSKILFKLILFAWSLQIRQYLDNIF